MLKNFNISINLEKIDNAVIIQINTHNGNNLKKAISLDSDGNINTVAVSDLLTSYLDDFKQETLNSLNDF